jgi:hypothetical protein
LNEPRILRHCVTADKKVGGTNSDYFQRSEGRTPTNAGIEFPYAQKRKILTTLTVSMTLQRNACPVHEQRQLSKVTERNERRYSLKAVSYTFYDARGEWTLDENLGATSRI